MFAELKKLIDNSYSPYSTFKVACIITDIDNNIYKGVNVENKYAKGLCAEGAALSSYMVSAKKALKDIYLLSNTENFITPCFLCREYIYENFSIEAKLYSYNKNGELKEYLIKDLLPHAFKLEA